MSSPFGISVYDNHVDNCTTCIRDKSECPVVTQQITAKHNINRRRYDLSDDSDDDSGFCSDDIDIIENPRTINASKAAEVPETDEAAKPAPIVIEAFEVDKDFKIPETPDATEPAKTAEVIQPAPIVIEAFEVDKDFKIPETPETPEPTKAAESAESAEPAEVTQPAPIVIEAIDVDKNSVITLTLRAAEIDEAPEPAEVAETAKAIEAAEAVKAPENPLVEQVEDLSQRMIIRDVRSFHFHGYGRTTLVAPNMNIVVPATEVFGFASAASRNDVRINIGNKFYVISIPLVPGNVRVTSSIAMHVRSVIQSRAVNVPDDGSVVSIKTAELSKYNFRENDLMIPDHLDYNSLSHHGVTVQPEIWYLKSVLYGRMPELISIKNEDHYIFYADTANDAITKADNRSFAREVLIDNGVSTSFSFNDAA